MRFAPSNPQIRTSFAVIRPETSPGDHGMRRLALLFASCAAPPEPQQGPQTARYGTSKGESLISFSQQIVFAESTSVITQAGYGVFLTDEHEVGGQLDIFDVEGFSIYNIGGYYNYNHRMSPRLWVYGGPHLGVSRIEAPAPIGDDTGISFGAHVGARFWLSPRTAAFIEQSYTNVPVGDDPIAFLIGFNVAFGLAPLR